MVRPKPKAREKIAVQVWLSVAEDQALADEASRCNTSKAAVLRAFVATLVKGKAGNRA
jgi:hypothetical protein